MCGSILTVEGLKKRFGALVAVDGISFTIEKGSIVGLAGPNGAGKTVTIDMLTGLIPPDKGIIKYKDYDITRLKPYQRSLLGIARTYQLTRIFPNLTVLENLLFAMQRKETKHNLFTVLFNKQRSETHNLEKAYKLLRFVNLEKLAEEKAKNLSYGQRKILSFISALATYPEPDLILLDEPMAGLHPQIISSFTQYIKEFNAEGKTFLLVEHNMRVLMDLCHKLIVMDKGKIIATGPPVEVRRMQNVIEAYLGKRG